MVIDYAIRIYNIGTPLKYCLTFDDVITFSNLQHKQSSQYYKWYNSIFSIKYNHNYTHDYDLEKLIEEYYDINIPIFMDKLENSNLLIKYDRHHIIKLMAAPVFYLFADNSFKLFTTIKSKYVSVQKGSGLYELKDLSGIDKRRERLVYIISINNKQYILKITMNTKFYKNEMEIYKELNAINGINNKVVKFYGGGEIELHSNGVKNDIIFKFCDDKEFFKLSYAKHPKMYLSVNQIEKSNKQSNLLDTDKILYSILEYDPTYTTLNNYMKINKKVSCKFIQSIVRDLIMLNNKFGFCHWDLHSNNLLVNDKLDYKIKIKIKKKYTD